MPYVKKHLSIIAVSASALVLLVVIVVRTRAPESKSIADGQFMELKRVDATDQLSPRAYGVEEGDHEPARPETGLDWIQQNSTDDVVSDLLQAQHEVRRQVSDQRRWGPNDFVPQSYRNTSKENALPRMDVDWDESSIEPLPKLEALPGLENSPVPSEAGQPTDGATMTQAVVPVSQRVTGQPETYTAAKSEWSSEENIEHAKESIRDALGQVADPILVVNLPTLSFDSARNSSEEKNQPGSLAQSMRSSPVDVEGGPFASKNTASKEQLNPAADPPKTRGSAWQSNPYFQRSVDNQDRSAPTGEDDGSTPTRSDVGRDSWPSKRLQRGERSLGEQADGAAQLLSSKIDDVPGIKKTSAVDTGFNEYLLDPEDSVSSELTGDAGLAGTNGTQPTNRQPFSTEPTSTATPIANSNLRPPTASIPKTPATKQPAAPEPAAPVGGTPSAVLKAGQFLLAEQPKMGAHFKDDSPITDRRAFQIPATADDFSPDPVDSSMPYDSFSQMDVYEGKTLNATRRPLIEIGRPWYQLGQLPEGSTIFGKHNPVTPQFIIFGDMRTTYASNDFGNDTESVIASELNLNWNLQLTGTERFHMFISPLDNGVKNHRYLLDEDRLDSELDFDVDFGYFEGDLGAIVGGAIGQTMPFDLPFAVGVMPLLVQNGVWMEDAFLGAAATIPARNSALLDISNMDITFFAGFDEIISPAFEGEDDVAKMWGVLSFIEANNGYWEIDYAFLEDRNSARDRSYHNIGIAFTRRYGRFISNSVRVIANAGQSTDGGPNTADGVLLLIENSLITGAPSTVVPYFNMFAGFDRPQSAARAGVAGGVLRNTGILFEPDGMTNYPTLDATANDTFGAAFGLNLLPNDFSQQLIVETAMLGVMGDRANRNAAGDQYGIGFRYQLPLNNATILRADGMFGALRGASDIHGIRMELRQKF